MAGIDESDGDNGVMTLQPLLLASALAEQKAELCVRPTSVEKWKKYAQKRVHHRGVKEAVLKTSYECTVPGCIARKVTERDTFHDGANGPLKYIFYANHNHPITEKLDGLMASPMATFDASHTGGRLKRKSKHSTVATTDHILLAGHFPTQVAALLNPCSL